MTMHDQFTTRSAPDAGHFLALYQMREWQELMDTQAEARSDLEEQLCEKYGWFSLRHLHEKNELRSLLASWHESDRVGMNYKHLYQTRKLRLSDDPSEALKELLHETNIEVETL